MEEDFEILEEYLRIYKEINEKYDNYFVSIKEIPIQAIENLLKRYKELEEENEQLREDVEGYSGLAKQIQEDYENRIDELENRDRFE